MRKHKNVSWDPKDNDTGNIPTWERVMVSVLLDIRDELQELKHEVLHLNRSIQCRNFQRVPAKLDRIGRAADKLAGAINAGGKS